MDNTSNLRALYSDSSSSYQWIYPTIFKNAARISNVPFSDIVFARSLARSVSSSCTLSFRVLHIQSLFFHSLMYSSFLSHSVKNDLSITLRFLDIRICYLCWDVCVYVYAYVRGTNFRFVLSIWNGAFSYFICRNIKWVLCTLSSLMHRCRQHEQQHRRASGMPYHNPRKTEKKQQQQCPSHNELKRTIDAVIRVLAASSAYK